MLVQKIQATQIPTRRRAVFGPSAAIPFPTLKNLNIVFKVTERCNLKCDYCYFFFAGDESWKDHPPAASVDALEAAVIFVRQAAKQYGLARVSFIFHGGEPLLAHKERFKSMCRILRGNETPTLKFDIGMQTNGVLIDDEWIDLFSEFNISVGISLDGTRQINDLHRLDTHGRSSYDATVSGLKKLQAAAKLGRVRFPGLICVVNPEADGAQVYRHFVDTLGVKSLHFLTPDLTHDTVPTPETVTGVNRFMLAVLQEWLHDNNRQIRIRAFSEPMMAMLDDEMADSVAACQEDYRNIVSISSNGDLGPEDTLKILNPRFSSMGLNVRSHTLADMIQTPIWSELKSAANKRPAGCSECGWWRCCKGGRLVTRHSAQNGLDNPSIYCHGLKDIYSTIAAHLVKSGISFDSILRRLSGPED